MNRNIQKAAVLGAAALLLGTAKADPLSWTEIGVGYNVADSGDDEVDAFDIRGSIGIADLFHGQLTYIDGSEGGGGPDFDGYELRAGVHPSVAENTQAVVELLYFDYSADYNSFDADEDGWGLGFGIRHAMGDQFEIRAQADYFDGTWEIDGTPVSEDFTNITYSFGARYYWTPNFFSGAAVILNGLEAASAADNYGDVLRIDVGWSFGADVL